MKKNPRDENLGHPNAIFITTIGLTKSWKLINFEISEVANLRSLGYTD